MNDNIKKQLQNVGENLGYQTKIYFKSHDLAERIQFSLLLLPLILTLISFYLSSNKILDYMSFGFSILALVYYSYFGKNTELYMSWGEKYLLLYKEVESYFKLNTDYDSNKIKEFIKKQNKLGIDKNRPNNHFFSKKWTDIVLEKEMKYSNEKIIWWK